MGYSRYTKPQMLLSVWFVSSMAFVYPVFRGRMDVKTAVALGKALRRASERAKEREREGGVGRRERKSEREREEIFMKPGPLSS